MAETTTPAKTRPETARRSTRFNGTHQSVLDALALWDEGEPAEVDGGLEAQDLAENNMAPRPPARNGF